MMLDVALIGTGYFSQFHCRAWQRMHDVRIVALHSQDAAIGQAFANEYGIATVFSDIDEMLRTSKPALVDIVTPPTSHAHIVRQCMAHHIPCICQKPFCNDLKQARALVNDIEAAGAKVVIHENFRFQPWYRELHRLLAKKLIGDHYEISFKLRPGDGQGPEAYLDRQPYFQQQEQFLVRETGVHYIDVFRYLFGDITGLFARLSTLNPVIAGEDAGVVIMEFATGARGVFNGNRLSDHATDELRRTMGEMVIEGSAGTLLLDGYGKIHHRRHGQETWLECHYDYEDIDFGGDCVYRMNRHVVDHLMTGSTLENDASAYLINREIEAAVYRSHEEGVWIPLNDKKD